MQNIAVKGQAADTTLESIWEVHHVVKVQDTPVVITIEYHNGISAVPDIGSLNVFGFPT